MSEEVAAAHPVRATERPHEFRRRIDVVHQPGRRNPAAQPGADDCAIGAGWSIVVARDAPPLVLGVAKDLQDYLLTSMDEPVLLERVPDVQHAASDRSRVIVLATMDDLPEWRVPDVPPSTFRLVCSSERIVICGVDARGTAQGSYFVEDQMNLRGGPWLATQDTTKSPLFSPRMTHSGWGLDEFPDSHLNAIAHAGMDSILVFVTGVDRTPDEHMHALDHSVAGHEGRYRDLNDLVDRAAAYGLDVYAYAYFRHTTLPHPADPGAEASYARTYGAVFEACPRLKGIILVGESVEFPSKDPRTTGRFRTDPEPDGLPPTKPSPGWWPCVDYPEWLEMVKRVVRRHNPDADIVFWTYNWGYAPEEDRLALIRSLPTDISLQVTFEMFEPIEREGVAEMCVDYTASFAGPGQYFRSEAEVAHERGIRLYTMANTGGLTWDFGVIPYEPIPYQWAERHAALLDARERWGLQGLMESHHYGWWPSFVSDLAKATYWSGGSESDAMCEALAKRDFGTDGAVDAVEAWRCWSEGIRHYVPTNEDQYGPFRTGPSYPLVFRAVPAFPESSHAMFGTRIFRIDYRMDSPGRAAQAVGPARIDAEIRSLQHMAELWRRGVDHMAQAVEAAPASRRADAERMLALGRFMEYSVRTTINVKEWWKRRHRLFGESDPDRATALLDEMVDIGEREIENARATIPLSEMDSRLGWEPTMDYVGGPDHLRWKIAQVRRVLDEEIPRYRRALEVRLPKV